MRSSAHSMSVEGAWPHRRSSNAVNKGVLFLRRKRRKNKSLMILKGKEMKTGRSVNTLAACSIPKIIKRRKILGLVAYNDVRNIFESRKISIEVKIRLLGSHIESIFLYNSELWTVTKATENTIDTFQRNIMRKILNIKWPDKTSNADLYNLTKTKEWSKKVKKRRLQWFGHLIRLPEDAPAKQALYAAQKQTKKPRGGQKTTWLKNYRERHSKRQHGIQVP